MSFTDDKYKLDFCNQLCIYNPVYTLSDQVLFLILLTINYRRNLCITINKMVVTVTNYHLFMQPLYYKVIAKKVNVVTQLAIMGT